VSAELDREDAASSRSVLVIDDDAALSRVMETLLAGVGYRVSLASCGKDGLLAAMSTPPDLVLLDLGLGDLDGVDVCRRLRTRWTYPIVVLSGEDEEHRKVEALDAGANDYVTKPFSAPELLARLRAALRTATFPAPGGGEVIEVGDVVIDVDAHSAMVDSVLLELTRIEFNLLVAFARGPGRVLTHDALARVIWPERRTGSSGAIRVHITNLRRKLGAGPRRPVITTATKLGYRLIVPVTGA
jgi:two-component system KDP operon response regulator KdpE